MVLVAAALVHACGTSALPGPEPDAGWAGGGRGGAGAEDGGATGLDAGTVADAGLPLALACDVLNRKRCDALARCGLVAASDAGREDCEAAERRQRCGPTRWTLHVEKGALRYDAVAGQACAEAWASLQCGALGEEPAPCARMLLPAAELGGVCYGAYPECVSGVCRGAACPRRCATPGLAGEVCTFDTDCAAGQGLFCQLSASMAGFGQCAALGAAGAACDDVVRCAVGLLCVANRCEALPTTGAACLLGACASGSVCVANPSGWRCEALRATGDPCEVGQCAPTDVCAAGRCRTRVLSEVGSPCVAEQVCPRGTACVGLGESSLGACVGPLGEGVACRAHSDCSAELACLSSDGGSVCARRLALGAACEVDRACYLDALCSRGRCVRAPELRQSCTADRRCGEGRCVSSPAMDGGWVCAPLAEGLEPCGEDAVCASGHCLNGVCRAECTP